MSTATRQLAHATIVGYTVAAGEAATLGRLAILSGADNTVALAPSASDLGIGVFRSTAVAGARVDVTLFGPVEVVVVGTGGATRGTKAIPVADGFTNAPAHAAGGGTANQIYGIFMQSGVAGDRVGLMLGAGNRISA